MIKLAKLWNSLTKLGLSNGIALSQSKYHMIVFTNKICLLGAILMVVGTLAMRLLGPAPSAPLVGILVIIFLFGLNLNLFGKYDFSRLIISIILPVIICGISIIAKRSHPELIATENFIIVILLILGISPLPLLLFSLEEKSLLLLAMVSNMIVLTFFFEIHDAFRVGLEEFNVPIRYPHLLKISILISWTFLNGIVFLVKHQFEELKSAA